MERWTRSGHECHHRPALRSSVTSPVALDELDISRAAFDYYCVSLPLKAVSPSKLQPASTSKYLEQYSSVSTIPPGVMA